MEGGGGPIGNPRWEGERREEEGGMGNRICGLGRRGAVEERLTRPQRLARQPSNVDYRKLRKLILSRKLAPCFDALEDPAFDLEECPICFFYYPSLNRSRCCSKGICTECFLQMKPSSAVRPAQCPFCKTSCYAVEYRGARSKEEKELELAEEQKVIEAKIRMQSQESQILEQAVAVNRTCLSSDVESPRLDEEEQSTGDLPVTRDLEVASMREDTETDCSHGPDICSTSGDSEATFWDADLEEIMVMEAIWQSLQDSKAGIPESSGAGGGLECGEKSKANQSIPTCPSLCECEASSSCACSLPEPVEGYASRLEALETLCDVMQARHKPSCEGSADESDGTETDVECQENFPCAEHDPSWRSARVVQDTHLRVSAQASAFATDSFSSSAKAETGSCFSSYVDSDASSSCDSPTFSNSDVGRGFPRLPMMIVMESSVQ